MSKRRIYRRDHPKAEAKVLTGVEKCPRCGALQDLKDKFVNIQYYDLTIKCWSCHACGHGFRTCNGEILNDNTWPVRQKAGSHRVELKNDMG